MADVLKQMYHDQPGTTWTTTTSYDTPAAGAVVRHIHISNGNTTTKYASVAMTATNSGTPAITDKALLYQVPIPANSIVDISTNIVLTGSDFLRFHAEATGVTITVSGVEL